jgi:hypothetical protein
MEGEGEGSNAWWPMEGEGESSFVRWPMEGKEEGKSSFSFFSHFPP